MPRKRQPVPIPAALARRTARRNQPTVPQTLTPKEQRFIQEYCLDLNATQAAIRAGYSKKTARQIGHRLLTKVDIEAAIADWKQRESERVGITRDAIVTELVKVHVVPVDPAKVRPADKLQAGMNIAKLLGFVTDKVEHSGSVETIDSLMARYQTQMALWPPSKLKTYRDLLARQRAELDAMLSGADRRDRSGHQNEPGDTEAAE